MSNEKRFTGRQVVTIVVAVAVAVIAFPVGVWAAGSTVVTIADPVHPTRKANVSANGHLAVDAQPISPAHPWSVLEDQGHVSDVVFGPTTSVLNITSITVTPNGNVSADFYLTRLTVAANATDCSVIASAKRYYAARAVSPTSAVNASFPTPLVVAPAPNSKQCVVTAASALTVSMSGFTS